MEFPSGDLYYSGVRKGMKVGDKLLILMLIEKRACELVLNQSFTVSHITMETRKNAD